MQLTGIPDEVNGTIEKIIPGSALDMSTYRSRYPTGISTLLLMIVFSNNQSTLRQLSDVKLCDIDHIFMATTINNRAPLVDIAHIQLVTQDVVEFTDHYGKRITLDLNWDHLPEARPSSSATDDTIPQDRDTEPLIITRHDEEGFEMVDLRDRGKERILSQSALEVVIPIE